MLAETTRNVKAQEPGMVHFAMSKSVDHPELYIVVEVYRDEAAFKAHWETDFIRPSLARTRALLKEGGMDIKRYESP